MAIRDRQIHVEAYLKLDNLTRFVSDVMFVHQFIVWQLVSGAPVHNGSMGVDNEEAVFRDPQLVPGGVVVSVYQNTHHGKRFSTKDGSVSVGSLFNMKILS